MSPAAVRPLLGEIRMTLLHGIKRLARGGHDQSWTHSDTEVVLSAEVSAGFPVLLQRLAPQLDGLSDRLASETATFLDVGVGVAVLSIEMVRLWPALRVVGIEPWAPSLALARQNVKSAGARGAHRAARAGGADLPDAAAFDLGWMPSALIPG